MLTSVNIEILAVSEVNKYLSWSKRIVPYIGTSNTYPLWDGDLVVYSSKSTNNSNNEVDRLIKVQVKGRIIKRKTSFAQTISFGVSLSDLNHYRKNGGIAYFVVCFNESSKESKIYYSLLTPEKLKSYLRDSKGRKTAGIKLKGVPELDRFYWECINFLNDRDWQGTFQTDDLTPINIIGKEFSFRISGPATSLKDVLDYHVGTNIPIYNTISVGGHQIQIPSGLEGTIVSVRCNKKVSIDGQVWYDSVKTITIGQHIYYSIGNVLSLVVDKNNQEVVWASLFNGTPNLSDILNAAEFIDKFLCSRSLKLGDRKFEVSIFHDQDGIRQVVKEAQLLRDILNNSGVSEDVRLADLMIGKDKDGEICLICSINKQKYAIKYSGINWSSLIQAK